MNAIEDKDLVRMADRTWVPPVKRLRDDPEFSELLEHHNKETQILLDVIQQLARRIVAKPQQNDS